MIGFDNSNLKPSIDDLKPIISFDTTYLLPITFTFVFAAAVEHGVFAFVVAVAHVVVEVVVRPRHQATERSDVPRKRQCRWHLVEAMRRLVLETVGSKPTCSAAKSSREW